jgi:T5SS/PEP-CTERM-associated repeat protein/autotransporter-associated beta strand protein
MAGLGSSSFAAINIWDGGSSNDNWTSGGNWFTLFGPGLAPANDGTADIIMPASGGLVQTPIVDVPYSIDSLTFNNGDGRFVILGAAELTIGAGGVTNNDADIQSLFGSLKLSANQTWTAAAGPLQMDAVHLNGRNLNFAGGFPIDLPNVIVGSGNLITSNASTVTMSGGASNTYAGDTSVQGGALRLQKTGGATAVPGDLFILGGGNVLLAGNEQISHASGHAVWMAPASGTASLNLNGFTETIHELHVVSGGSISTVTTGAGTLNIGQFIEVSGASSTITGNISLGDVTAFVHADGEISTNNNIFIGDFVDGTLNILTGGDVRNSHAYLGWRQGSTGAAIVDGAGSTWICNGGVTVGAGFFTSGALDITAGGAVRSTYGTIAWSPGSSGVVTVDGTGSTWTNSGVLTVGPIGYSNDATLEITNGGTVTVAGATTVNSISEINVSDGTFDAVGDLTIDGGSLTADAGAIVEFGGGTVRNGATITLQNQSELTADSALYLQSGAVMRVNSGATYNTDFTVVGYLPGPVAELIIDGADTLVTSTSCCIDVGYGGTGVMTVSGGARVETPTGAVGSFASGASPSVGALTLDGRAADGTPSTWAIANLNMGLSATSQGTASILNGALLETNDLRVGTPGSGVVNVVGRHSSGSPSLLHAGYLELGGGGFGNGTGEVTASQGGRIEAGNVAVASAGGAGTLTVTDEGSMLVQIGASNVTVGSPAGGTGVINIVNNGHVTTGAGAINVNATGQINLDSGGVLDAHGPINMNGGQFNFLGGTLHVNAFNGNLLNEGGTLAPGHSAGATAISGNYTQRDDATLEIEIGGVLTGQWDTLAIGGNASLNGALEVKLLDGFEPVLGNSFTILTTDAGNVGGPFDELILPLVNGVGFDIVYNPKSVVLVARPAYTADFDEDGDVDGDDLVQWQGDFGANALSDADDDGDSDGHDFLEWQRQLGSVAAMAAPSPVPEPEMGLLIALSVALVAGPKLSGIRHARDFVR